MIEPTWRECSGAYDCSALEHVEGCFAPLKRHLGQAKFASMPEGVPNGAI